MTSSVRFEPREPCAIEPRAFGAFFMPAPKPEPQLVDGVAILRVNGPLTHQLDPMLLSYEEIVCQARAVMAHSPRAVVLRVDSPGGLASGVFEAARELRTVFKDVPVYAHVSGSACSAAYALACAADEIVVSPAALVGSVGVIDVIVDATESDAKAGVAFHVVKSGARKADGNPHTPVEESALVARQSVVDDFAKQFFVLVAEARPLTPEQVSALEAGVFTGARAVDAGLADRVEDFSDFFARIGAGEMQPGASAPLNGGADMATKEEAIAALKKAAEDGDDEAKRMLAALEEPEKKDEAEPAEGKAETPEPEKDDEAEAVAASTILSLSAKVAKLEAAAAAKAEAEERQALLASRPDLPAETVAWLKTQPLSAVRGAITAIPKTPGLAQGLAATAVVPATVGEGQLDESARRLSPEAKADLDARMGLLETKPVVINKGNKLILGARVPVTGKDA